MRAIKVLLARRTAAHHDEATPEACGRVDIIVHLEFPGSGRLARAIAALKVLATVTVAVATGALGGGAVKETIWCLARLLFGHGG